jgi:NAD(P)-dependent dehydrogenase (short-subunit alcohol dehydrogenase family)
VDVLINNSTSADIVVPFIEQKLESLMLLIKTGLILTWQMMQLCFSLMKDKGGSIIGLGSSSSEGLVG